MSRKRTTLGDGDRRASAIMRATVRLSYRVELWRGGDGAGDGGIERVVARAASAQLAHAIFRAVRSEHPERRIILREGDRVVADSREE
jgi:hypothetical protein